jgi:ABC-2 type transport system ATP-binding protein
MSAKKGIISKIKRFFSWFGKPVVAEGVGFSYAEREVLRDITLHLKEKEIVAIIGKSGSGKSTFLKLVAGIIPKGRYGKIRIFGKPTVFGKSKIGFVPQELAFIPDLSLFDNVRISGLNLGISEKEAIRKSQDLMELLKLDEDFNKKPEQLSGGQRVRLNIILSLLHDPEIVILDEPFVGLDFMNRRLLWHFIDTMKRKKKAVILTSHLLSEAQEHADRLVILKKGKVFFNGNLEQLKKKLKMNFVFEVRFSRLSDEAMEKIRKFCVYKDMKILDRYEKHFMFGLQSERNKNTLSRLFQKLSLNFEEVGFREPNLDEVFLRT